MCDVCAGFTTASRAQPTATLAWEPGRTGRGHPPPLGPVGPAPAPPGGAAVPGGVLGAPDPARAGWPPLPGLLVGHPRAQVQGAGAGRERLGLSRAGLERAGYAQVERSHHLGHHLTKALVMHTADQVWEGASRHLFLDASGQRVGAPHPGRGWDFQTIPGRRARIRPSASGRPSGWWALCKVIWAATAPPPFPLAPPWPMPSGGQGVSRCCGSPAICGHPPHLPPGAGGIIGVPWRWSSVVARPPMLGMCRCDRRRAPGAGRTPPTTWGTSRTRSTWCGPVTPESLEDCGPRPTCWC